MPVNPNRRQFLSAVGAGLSVASAASAQETAAPLDVVRIGLVGAGSRGRGDLANFLKLEGVQVLAVCDIVEDNAALAQKMVIDAGRPSPQIYSRGDVNDENR